MLFNSNAFYVFLPIAFIVYWLTPRRYRWGVLLLCSYYFYMSANAGYGLLLLLTTVVSYGTALALERAGTQSMRRLCLGAALAVCLGILFLYKYFDFLSLSLRDMLRSISIPMSTVTLNLTLPVGISFYVFQSLGYVIDVYRAEQPACRHFGKYAAFVSFFPLLLAGPIERAKNLLPQIEKSPDFDERNAIYGAKLIAWGFFKKLAIADTVAAFVDTVYGSVNQFTGLALVVATLLYSIQVYCDFSGYSDIARGVAKLLNLNLTTNFVSPYFSASCKEFWSRWHISLSTWFRDYIYFPLGGSRRGTWRTYWNLMITFLVSGLWHGANWTFVVWGAVHGVWQVVERMVRRHFSPRADKKRLRWLKVLGTFLLVSFAWIFFRADSLRDAAYVITHLFSGITDPLAYVKTCYTAFENAGIIQSTDMKLVLVWIVILALYDLAQLKADVWEQIGTWKKPVRYAVYFGLIFLVLYSRQLGEYEFVYFQF